MTIEGEPTQSPPGMNEVAQQLREEGLSAAVANKQALSITKIVDGRAEESAMKLANQGIRVEGFNPETGEFEG